MLKLSRRIGEGIAIGNGVIVKVDKLRGKYVQLAVEAPQEMRIRRIDNEKKQAKT